MIERHFHWEFLAYDDADAKEDGTLKRNTLVTVIGYLSEADARVAAKDIITRDHFSLRSVWECAACGFQQQTADSLQNIASKA